MFNSIIRKNKVDFYKFYADKTRNMVVVPVAISTPVSKLFLSKNDAMNNNTFKMIDCSTHNTNSYIKVYQSDKDYTKHYHDRDDINKTLIVCIIISGDDLHLFEHYDYCPSVVMTENEFKYKGFEEVIKFTDYNHTAITERDINGWD